MTATAKAWERYLAARADYIEALRDNEDRAHAGSWEQIMLACNITETQAQRIYDARKQRG